MSELLLDRAYGFKKRCRSASPTSISGAARC
jgi:hypothetical protein